MCGTRSWHTYEMHLVSLRKSGVTKENTIPRTSQSMGHRGGTGHDGIALWIPPGDRNNLKELTSICSINFVITQCLIILFSNQNIRCDWD
jgi:hypothetical protein